MRNHFAGAALNPLLSKPGTETNDGPPARGKADNIAVLAQAERILSRTLAYQAAMVVHELKDLLDVDIQELRLAVTPPDLTNPGCYRVTCTIASLESPQPVGVDIVVQPEKASVPSGKANKAPKPRGRR